MVDTVDTVVIGAGIAGLCATLALAREGHYAASDSLHAASGEMQAANSEGSRLEAEIGHLRNARSRLEARLLQLDDDGTRWGGERDRLAGDETRWSQLLENAKLRAATAAARPRPCGPRASSARS